MTKYRIQLAPINRVDNGEADIASSRWWYRRYQTTHSLIEATNLLLEAEVVKQEHNLNPDCVLLLVEEESGIRVSYADMFAAVRDNERELAMMLSSLPPTADARREALLIALDNYRTINAKEGPQSATEWKAVLIQLEKFAPEAGNLRYEMVRARIEHCRQVISTIALCDSVKETKQHIKALKKDE